MGWWWGLRWECLEWLDGNAGRAIGPECSGDEARLMGDEVLLEDQVETLFICSYSICMYVSAMMSRSKPIPSSGSVLKPQPESCYVYHLFILYSARQPSS